MISFLEPNAVPSEKLLLYNTESISIQKYILHLEPWCGAPIPNTYNGKAVIDWYGEPVFAELAILRLFKAHGWEGVWVDSYRRKFRIGLPDVVQPIEPPRNIIKLIESTRRKTGRSGGCWDVLVWKNEKLLFVELKRSKKDRIRDSQIKWLQASIESGLGANNFALIEWTLGALPTNETTAYSSK